MKVTETPETAPAVYPEPRSQRGTTDGGLPHGSGSLVKWFAVLAAILLIIGAYNFLERRNAEHVLAKQTDSLAVPHVAIIHATVLSGDAELILPGNIQPYVESPIYARTNGYLKAWYRDIGSHVKKGDLLAIIDTPEIDEQLSQARADLATAQANLKLAAITEQRYKDLAQTDAVSKQDVDNANGDYGAKQAIEASAEANVNRLEALESFKNVYAPFDGVITQRNVDIGTLINAGNTGTTVKEMFDLAQVDPLRVYVSVPQTNAPSIHVGMKSCLELSEFPGREFCGSVVRTAGAVDPSTRTLLTEVDVPNRAGTLLSGEYAQVHFDAKLSGQRLSLPNNALLFRPEGTMSATVGPNNRIDLKKLTIGRDLGNSVEVLEGITTEDAVVINPPDSLAQGETVAISNKNASTN